MVSEVSSRQSEKKENFNLASIKDGLKHHLYDVVSYLGLKLEKNGSLLIGCCPIHGGDNPTAFQIQTEGSYRGKIQCWTGSCNRDGTDLLSLIMRVKKVSFIEAIKIAKTIIGNRYTPASVPFSFICEESLDQDVEPLVLVGKYSRQTVRNLLEIPSPYYYNRRHFDAKILDDYDIGDCWVKGNRMRGRTVFPVYDENYLCVGAVGRRISDTWNTMKWKNSKGFKASNTFYGLWNYNNTGRAILVEGQGDLVKLRQAGYSDSLGMFKKCASINQLRILKKMGVTDLLVITDNDKAGNEGYQSIVKLSASHFKIDRYIPRGKDVGEMSPEDLVRLCL